MLEKYDEFTNKKKNIDNQKKQLKQKLNGLNKQKLQIKMDQYTKRSKENAQKNQEIAQKMNKFVNGASSYSS